MRGAPPKPPNGDSPCQTRDTARSAASGVDRRTTLKLAAAFPALLAAIPGTLRAAPADTALKAGATGSDAPFASEIAPQVYAHKGHVALVAPGNGGDIANMGFIVGREAVAVVDTGCSARVGAALHAAVRAVTALPIRYVINTHMHPDHVLGNAAFEADAPAFVAHHKMARGLSARAERYLAVNKEAMGEDAFAGTRIVLPTLAIAERTTLDLGGREIVLDPQKTAHTDNDLIVRDTETGTAFLGDLLFSEHVPTLDGSIRGWLSVLEALAAVPTERVVPGHGPPSMPWPAAAQPIERYLQIIADQVRALIKDNHTISEAMATVGLSEKSAWQLFDDYHPRNVSAAFAELEWE